MLERLRRILHRITPISDPLEALRVMVSEVRLSIDTDACSVYLREPHGQYYVLLASEGFKSGVDGSLVILRDQGLVGWVGSRAEPLNTANAPLHPHYHYFPETGEEIYAGFLGVPIVHQGELLGVLVVQHKQTRVFDIQEESFLVTIAAQLGGVIATAQLSGLLNRFSKTQPPAFLQGEAAAPGIAMGTAVWVHPAADLDWVVEKNSSDLEVERQLFEKAVRLAREEIAALGRIAADQQIPEAFEIFEVYLEILDQTSFHEAVYLEISQGQWAQGALKRVMMRYIQQFQLLDDSYFNARGQDIADLAERILFYLQQDARQQKSFPDHTILVGADISATLLAEVPIDQLAAVVAMKGSVHSHAAVIARGLNIPTVMSVDGLDLASIEGREVIVDGYMGRIYVAPSQMLKRQFLKLMAEEKEFHLDLNKLNDFPAQTPDGHIVGLQMNTGMLSDFFNTKNHMGIDGIGLYRTEVPFMIRDRFPTEEEQRILYRQALEQFYPKPVVMRTLDIGGDKNLSYFPIKEDNPFLGWRGLRVCLDHPDIFLVQLKAMLLASCDLDNLSILLPMVMGVSELKAAKKRIDQVYLELQQEGHRIKKPKVGIMIEVPSIIYQLGAVMKEIDFMSIGTNDLIQYLLAVDRNNTRISHLYNSLHPAVIRALFDIAQRVRRFNTAVDVPIPVSVCGEMASDPLGVIVLLGMGYDILSMNFNSMNKIKWLIRSLAYRVAQSAVTEILHYEDESLIRAYLEQVLHDLDLGVLIGRHE
jgi:phosphotransferase system enzyme I (PtsP)